MGMQMYVIWRNLGFHPLIILFQDKVRIQMSGVISLSKYKGIRNTGSFLPVFPVLARVLNSKNPSMRRDFYTSAVL